MERLKKILKIIAGVCLVVLIIEFGYVFYNLIIDEGKSIYFDGINSLYVNKKNYITVGSNNNNENYLEKAKITKYNQKKEKLFEKLYNKGFNGAFFDVVVDDKDLIAVGSYEKDEREHENNLRSALIVKYDADGNILFESDFQVLGQSKFVDVKVVEDGYLVCGQSIYDNLTIGDSKKGGAFLIKYGKDLKVDWKVNYGSSKHAIYNDILVDDDTIYVVGKNDERVGIVSIYKDDGDYVSTTKYKNTDNLGFTGINKIDNRLFVVGGKVNGNDTGNTDALIVKYNLSGEYRGEVVYSNDASERFNRVEIDENDNVIVIGTTSSPSKKNTGDGFSVYSYDGLIGKYNKELDEATVITYGDERDDYFTDVKVVNGKYLVIGYSSYEDGSYLSKFITYSDALKVLGVE